MARAVAATASRSDKQARGFGVACRAHAHPPAADRAPGKRSGVVSGAHAHPAVMVRPIMDPRGIGTTHLGNEEVLHAHGFGLAFGVPFAPAVLEVAHACFLLGVHGEDGLTRGLRRADALVAVLKWSVASRRGAAFARLAVGWPAVAFAGEEFGHQLLAHAQSPRWEFVGKVAHALGGPTQRVLWGATRGRRHQPEQLGEPARGFIDSLVAPSATAPDAHERRPTFAHALRSQRLPAYSAGAARHAWASLHGNRTAVTQGLRLGGCP